MSMESRSPAAGSKQMRSKVGVGKQRANCSVSSSLSGIYCW